MNPSSLDSRHLPDGPCEFPLQRATVIHFLGKIPNPQAGAIKNFKSNITAIRKPFTRHLQAQLMDPILRHHHGVAPSLQRVGDRLSLKPSEDCLNITFL